MGVESQEGCHRGNILNSMSESSNVEKRIGNSGGSAVKGGQEEDNGS